MTIFDEAIAVVFAGRRAGEEIELYGQHRRATRIDAGAAGVIRSVSYGETRGVGIRLVRMVDRIRTGFASTSDLTRDGLLRALDEARGNAGIATPDETGRLPRPAPSEPTSDPGIAGIATTPLTVRTAIAADLARTAGIDPRVRVDTATYRDERVSIVVASTNGARARHDRGCVTLDLDVIGEDRHGTATATVHQFARTPDEADVGRLAAAAVDRAARLLGPHGPTPAGLPLILRPEVSAVLLGALGRAFAGPALTGRGPLAGRLGRKVNAHGLTLVDDGLHWSSPHAAPFDDEGTPRQRTTLIEDGTAIGVLHSSSSAPNTTGSTGNARRGSHKSLPVPAPTTLVLRPFGDGSVRDAIDVAQLSGESGINSVTGRADIVLIGHLRRDGEPAGPLDPIPLRTTLVDLLAVVTAVDDDAGPSPAIRYSLQRSPSDRFDRKSERTPELPSFDDSMVATNIGGQPTAQTSSSRSSSRPTRSVSRPWPTAARVRHRCRG